jgi:LPXTG-motif cell wall-anchored protein
MLVTMADMNRFRVLVTVAGLALVAWAPAIAAQPVDTYVGGVDIPRPQDGRQPTQPAAFETVVEEEVVEEDELPVTGGDVVQLAAIGAGAIAVGAALHFRRRRAASEPAPAQS